MATQNGAVSNFKNVNVVITGPAGFRVDAYADGASVSIAFDGDRNSVRRGNDGISQFAEVEGSNAIATLTLLQDSETNDKLSAWLASGVTQGLQFVEVGSTTVVSTDQARVRQFSGITRSAGVETTAWDIHLISPTVNVGHRQPNA